VDHLDALQAGLILINLISLAVVAADRYIFNGLGTQDVRDAFVQ
jgi:hypothetical protein